MRRKIPREVSMNRFLWLFLMGWLGVTSLWAQPPGGPPAVDGPPGDRVTDLLFSPQLVMRNQAQLGITTEQREYIVEQIQEAQAEYTARTWELEGATEELALRIQQGAEESLLLEQLDRVLELEREIKRARFLLSVRIRNILTPEQLSQVERLKGDRRFRPGRTQIPRRP